MPATGLCTIAPTSALPAVTGTTVIDGYTQPGATPNTNPPDLGINQHGGSEDSNGVTINGVGELDGVQNFPVLTSVSVAAGNATISGTLTSTASTLFRVEFFSSAACDPSGFGEGQTFLGTTNVTTDAGGNAAFGPLVFAVPGGQTIITSTATNPAGDTSEYSQRPAALPGATSTVLASSLNPSTVGQSVTFTATITGSSPTGTVQFKDGVANLGAAVAVSGGAAQLATSALAQGTHPITAVYGGDANNATSISPVVNQVVNAAGPPPPPAPPPSLGATPIPTCPRWHWRC